MDIAELIKAVGVEKVGVQFLDQCSTKMNWHHKRGADISFSSDVGITPEGTEKLGVIVWMDRAEVRRVIDAERASQ